jgi:8-oxo-dGTP pyrophosphatase MutT (NUDIX family)
MGARPWKLVGSKVLHDTPVFTLREDICTHPVTGKDHPFYVVETMDWVNVLPITDDGNAVLLKQWRHGIRDFCIEIPGGMLEPGEDPDTAAARELREETGYGFDSLVALGPVATNPAINTNLCHLYVASGARPQTSLDLDETEDLEVVPVPLDEALAMVEDGRIDHTMVVNTFLKLQIRYGKDAEQILTRLR